MFRIGVEDGIDIKESWGIKQNNVFQVQRGAIEEKVKGIAVLSLSVKYREWSYLTQVCRCGRVITYDLYVGVETDYS